MESLMTDFIQFPNSFAKFLVFEREISTRLYFQ